ncbi:RNA polymerase sigma factor, RpoD/SigA family [Leptolyngbya sp. FACHB-261]|uniref:RNA polymerase sigma factor, RpoD/SigA family n=1 Tax=Leptolyngbya sp. FACHB-261 TaxID=2692806 RepID=UPI00168778E5|nr:RNA polymerase sigma factor, RpoD/SigA family [Leptolyngbya sp. FACHB-261]MBD2104224.1 RNA polymerase sigma factor, RpoD/SigA family [Leptolyngbya sp. FACHB-261]
MAVATLKSGSAAGLRERDAVGLFLHKMGKHELLTHEEEIQLARQVQLMMQCLHAKDNLTEQLQREPSLAEIAESLDIDVAEVNQRLEQGQRAKQRMIEANLRLVVSIARKYLNRGLDLLELIQEGSLGLERGVEKFDPSKGFRFSTYAYWWIRQGITRALATQGRMVRLPVHIVEKLNKLKKSLRELTQRLGRGPTQQELADYTGFDLETLRSLRSSYQAAISLNTLVGDDEKSELGDLLEDKLNASPEEHVAEQLRVQQIEQVLEGVLTEREAEVIRLRYGFDSGKPLTLADVGKQLNVSRERVRQLETTAMKKLRQPEVRERLGNWLGAAA